MHLLVLTKSVTRKDNQLTGQCSLICGAKPGVCCLKQIADRVDANSYRKVSEHPVHHSLLHSCRPDIVPMLKVPTVGVRNGPQSCGRRLPGLINHILLCIMWKARCLCVLYQDDALWEELKPTEARNRATYTPVYI